MSLPQAPGYVRKPRSKSKPTNPATAAAANRSAFFAKGAALRGPRVQTQRPDAPKGYAMEGGGPKQRF